MYTRPPVDRCTHHFSGKQSFFPGKRTPVASKISFPSERIRRNVKFILNRTNRFLKSRFHGWLIVNLFMFNLAVRNRALVRKFRNYFRKTGEEDRKILQIEKQTGKSWWGMANGIFTLFIVSFNEIRSTSLNAFCCIVRFPSIQCSAIEMTPENFCWSLR